MLLKCDVIISAPATSFNFSHSKPSPETVNVTCSTAGIYPRPTLSIYRYPTRKNRSVEDIVQCVQSAQGTTISCPWRLIASFLTLREQAEIGKHQVDRGEDAQWSFRNITFFRRWRAIVKEGVYVRMWTSYSRNWLHPEAEDGLLP